MIMAASKKLFLKHVASSWRRRFPFLLPVHLPEVPQVPKGCNFLCDDYAATRSRYYFVQVDFLAEASRPVYDWNYDFAKSG